MSSDGRVLGFAAYLAAALLVVAGFGLGVDHHSIAGAPAWLKPAKFALSVSIYCVTVAWLLTLLPGHTGMRLTIAWVTGAALVGELALIDIQVLRGTTSHFNTQTTFDRGVFGAMGVLVALVFLAAVVLAVHLVRAPGISPVMRAGVVSGLAVCLLGMAEAGLMVAHEGHTVGASDASAGAGMWLTGWSLSHGDLRIAHFIGLHSLQVIPLCARVVERLIEPRRGIQVVAIIAVFHVGLIVLLSWEAELGRPLQRPGLTVGVVAAGWCVATATAIGLRLRRTPIRLYAGGGVSLPAGP